MARARVIFFIRAVAFRLLIVIILFMFLTFLFLIMLFFFGPAALSFFITKFFFIIILFLVAQLFHPFDLLTCTLFDKGIRCKCTNLL